MGLLKKFESSNFYRSVKLFAKRIIGKEVKLSPKPDPSLMVVGDWGFLANLLGRDSVIYSFGVGDDLSLDEALVRRFDCVVHAFDPTVENIDGLVSDERILQSVKFYQWAVMGEDGTFRLYERRSSDGRPSGMYSLEQDAKTVDVPITVPGLSVASIMKALDHFRVDVIKFDVEGAEYQAVNKMLEDQVFPRQVLIEFHHRFKTFSLSDTKFVIDKLTSVGYQVTYVSRTGREVSFSK